MKKDLSFRGYNVYQVNSDFPTKENSVKIATYDIVDGIKQIPGFIMDPETGLAVEGIVVNGTDSGIERSFATNYDYLDSTQMLVGRKYYYAVTAFAYNPSPQLFTNVTESILDIFELEYYESLEGPGYGDEIEVQHTEGEGDGKVKIKVVDATKLTGEDYEVYFRIQDYYRNENGEWIPIGGRDNSGLYDPDTLTGSSIDIVAVYGPNAGEVQLNCRLNIVSPDWSWVDGITMTFPAEISVIDVPEFEAGGGTVTPEFLGNVVNMGIVDGSQTGDGIFHGDEEWIMFISTFGPPVSVEWILYDDGYSGGAVNAERNTLIEVIGYEYKTQHEWNLRNLTRLDTLLEDQTVIEGFDLYTKEYVGDPVVEGFQISVYANYFEPTSYGLVTLNGEPLETYYYYGEPLNDWYNEFWRITDYTIFGYPTGTSYDKNGYGTTNISELSQDYKFRWTGIEELVNINGQLVYVTKEGTGSIATLYGARQYDLKDHPLNPDPSSSDPFLVRVPFEVWNKTTGQQVNYQIYDRAQSDPAEDYFKIWNTDARMYAEILNTPYDSTNIANGELGGADTAHYTWMNVWYKSQWSTGDLIETYYHSPVTPEDKFTFTTPQPVDTTYEFIPNTYRLYQNYPNPFNPATTIRLDIPQQGIVKLEIYNILGQRVAQLLNSELPEGRYEMVFNGSTYASGVYFYILQIEDTFFEAKKMLLLK